MPIAKIDISNGCYLNVKEIVTREGISPKFYNGFLDDGKSNVKWFGDSSFVDLDCDFFNGMFYSRNLDKLIAVADGKVYNITQGGVATQISTGAPLEATKTVSFVEAPALLEESDTYSPKVFMCNGGNLYYTDGSTVTKVEVDNAPTQAKTVVFTDYQIVTDYDERFFIHSEPGALIDFGDATNIIAADSSPDEIVAVAVLNRELYVFGTLTIDTFFYSSYASTVTWTKTAGALLDQGCAAKHSIQNIDNTLYWLNHRREIVRLEGRTPRVISGPITKELQKIAETDDAIAHHVIYGGKNFYLIVFPQAEKSFLYDYVQDAWSQLGDWDSEQCKYLEFPMYGYAWDSKLNRHYWGNKQGAIFKLDDSIATNDSITNRFCRRTGHISHGSLRNRKRCNRITFLVETGEEFVQIGATPQREGLFSVRYRDQNGEWSNEMFPSLKAVGDNNFIVELFNQGTYVTRQWEIAQSDEVPFTLVFMEEEFEVQL